MTLMETLNAINSRTAEINAALPRLPDEIAIEVSELFPYWRSNMHYEKSTDEELLRVRDPEDGYLYRLIPKSHDSLSTWPPHLVPAIWTRVDEPGEEWPEWRQPTGAQDAYAANAKVSHNGQHWINTFGDGNVWEPGVYGWEAAE